MDLRNEKLLRLLRSTSSGSDSGISSHTQPATTSQDDSDTGSASSGVPTRGRGQLKTLTPIQGSAPTQADTSRLGPQGFLAQLHTRSVAGTLDKEPPLTPPAVGSMGRGRGRIPVITDAAVVEEKKTNGHAAPPYLARPDLVARMGNLTVTEEEEAPPVVKRGEVGERISVRSNYVSLTMDPGKGVFEYEVRFAPDIDYRAFRARLINEHVKKGRGIRCYDGASKLYLPEKISEDVFEVLAQHPGDNSPVKMTVKYKKRLRLGDCTHLYNVLLNNCSKELGGARLGRKFYDAKAAHLIPQHKLEVWPGYVTAVEEFEGGVHLCCDINHRVLRMETAYTIIHEAIARDKHNFQDICMKELVGECVLTRYNNALYRIDDIAWDSTPLSAFETMEGSKVTFLDYYKKQYGLDIRDLHQPLLVSRSKKWKDGDMQMICLVPELSYLTGLSDKMRADFKIMKDIAVYTRVSPQQRHLAFLKFLRSLKENTRCQEMLGDWGLRVSAEPAVLDARVLPPENIYFGRNMVVQGHSSAEWKRATTSNSVLRSVSLNTWLLVYCEKDKRRAVGMWNLIERNAGAMGIRVERPQEVALRDDRIDSYVTTLRSRVVGDTQAVLILVPTNRDDRYQAIKKLLCKEMPVISQVVLSNTLAREDRSRAIVQNIMLQINAKMGGALWTVQIPLKNTMVCGIDSYHSPASMKGGKSVGALVCTTDHTYTKFFSKAAFQDSGQELLDSLIVHFGAALRQFEINEACLPDRIIVYRDGVGNGALATCRDHEVSQFYKACSTYRTDYAPKLTFIVVSKRINTKYFIQRGELENVPPGSVLDHTITRRNFHDFFLVSQKVNQGTASPSHFIILHDTSDLNTDKLQRLTFKFCHMYFNWSGTVRVPAPCQYAHKLAYLVGESVKAVPHEFLDDKLYFL